MVEKKVKNQWSKALDRTKYLSFAKLIKHNVPTYGHSKTAVELVQALDYASKMDTNFSSPFTVTKWSKAKVLGVEPIIICCLP